MALPAQQQNSPIKKPVADFFAQDNIKNRFNEILGKRGAAFVSSVLAAVNSSDQLKTADPATVYTAAMMAATLDLPINNNLGFAFLIPYSGKCQFQISAKGFKQLAMRSGQFLRITDAIVYDGQLIEENPLTGYLFDWTKKKSDTVIGFVSYFKLLNGFESTFYMKSEEVLKHGKKFSKTFKGGLWETDFEKMALKTVTKLNLSKNAPLSIEMQKAQLSDQSVIVEAENGEFQYVDNMPAEPIQINHEAERLKILLADCKTAEEVDKVAEQFPEYDHEIFSNRKIELKK